MFLVMMPQNKHNAQNEIVFGGVTIMMANLDMVPITQNKQSSLCREPLRKLYFIRSLSKTPFLMPLIYAFFCTECNSL